MDMNLYSSASCQVRPFFLNFIYFFLLGFLMDESVLTWVETVFTWGEPSHKGQNSRHARGLHVNVKIFYIVRTKFLRNSREVVWNSI